MDSTKWPKISSACFFIAISIFVLLIIIDINRPGYKGFDFIVKYWYLFLVFLLSIGIIRLHNIFERKQ